MDANTGSNLPNNAEADRSQSPLLLRLMHHVVKLGLPYGREDSFKMVGQQVLQDRVLIGYDTGVIGVETFYSTAFELGMPPECKSLLDAHIAQANAVLFGVEGSVCKVYLEFWDQVRRQVRSDHSKAPQLLHLGVKWDSARPHHHEVAHYLCHPMLSAKEVLRGMASVYPNTEWPSAQEDAKSIVRQGMKKDPAASMLYMEVREKDNPRRSFDVNLYKTQLRVGEVETELLNAATHLGVPLPVLLPLLRRMENLPLGHIAGGTDRHGREFLSVYAERQTKHRASAPEEAGSER